MKENLVQLQLNKQVYHSFSIPSPARVLGSVDMSHVPCAVLVALSQDHSTGAAPRRLSGNVCSMCGCRALIKMPFGVWDSEGFSSFMLIIFTATK